MCLVAALALGGCGESSQAKAEKTVCEGKTEATAGVEALTKATTQVPTIAGVEDGIAMISSGLKKIGSAQSDLTGARKEQVEQANSTLSSDLSKLKQELKSLSPSQIKQQLTTAVEQLASSYKQALAPISC